jgi:hypothetical protein
MSNSRRGHGILLWGIVLLSLFSARAGAEIVDEEEVGRLTIGLYFGYGGASMDAFNENIGVVNHFLTHQGIQIREADTFGGSANIEGELRYKFGDRFSVGVGVGNAESKSAFDVTFAAVDFYTRTTIWSVMGYYHLPFVQSAEAFAAVADRMSIYVGAGPLLLTKGRAHMRITDRTTEPSFNVDGDLIELDGQGDATGTGSGLQGVLGASYMLNSRFSFAGEVGYRVAKISDLELVKFEGDITDQEFEDLREPGNDAILDFFRRERGAREARGIPENDIEGDPIPYYSDFDGPLELDFSGVTLQAAFRIHLF